MIQMHLMSALIPWMPFMRKNINDYNRSKKSLIILDDFISDIMANKKFQAIINELLIRSRKLNILLVLA